MSTVPLAGVRALLISANREAAPQPVYPLGLEYIRYACEQSHIETRVFDCNWLADEQDFGPLESALKEFSPAYVLLSIRNVDSIESQNIKFYIPFAGRIVEHVRKASCAPVITGGSGFSLFPAEILKRTGADFGICGPGEKSIAKLLERLQSGRPLHDVPGAVYREGERITVNAPDHSPVESRILTRSKELLTYYWEKGGLVGIQLKRGCPLKCIYCTYPALEGNKLALRDIEQCAGEMEHVLRTFGMDHFFIVDDVFNAAPAAADAFAEEILRRKLKVRWTCFCSPRGVTAGRVELWKAAGLHSIEFGVDTLAESLIKTYQKGFAAEDMFCAAEACAGQGIPYSLFFIFGGPGETLETVEETIKHCSRFKRAAFFALLGMRIYPGTPLFDMAVSEGHIEPDAGLLEPVYYLSKQLDQDKFRRRMSALSTEPGWFVSGFGLKEKESYAQVLRKHGERGSLWEHAIR